MFRVAGINPWLSIWFSPRSTIRILVTASPNYGVFFLAVVFALQNFIFHSQYWFLEIEALAVGVILTPVMGFLWLYATSTLFYYTGKLFHGSASLLHLRTVVGWSKLPALIGIPFAYLSGNHFIGQAIQFVSHGALFILSFWSFVILVQGLREVQQFSLLSSVCNVLIVWAITFLAVSLLFRIVFLIH
jgi:hypothetical protein